METVYKLENREDVFEPIELVIRLEPKCEAAGNVPTYREKKLKLMKYPETSRHLKLVIEDELQVPVYQQKLLFHSQLLPNNQCLRGLYLRNGDDVTVEYTTLADVRDIADIIQHMNSTIDFLMHCEDWLEDFSFDLEKNCKLLIKPEHLESLVTTYFYLSDVEKSAANRLYFVHNKGLDLAVDLHRVLSSLSWNSIPPQLQHMEHAVLRLIWDLSSTIGVRCLLLQKTNLIQQLCQSILRQEIIPYQFVRAHGNQKVTTTDMDHVLAETMYKGIGVLAK